MVALTKIVTKQEYNNIRGTFTENVPLGARSWFRCGGSADLVFAPADVEDLAAFLRDYPVSEPLTILGGMANTIIRDGGIRGVTVMLGKPFADITVQGTTITAGAGTLNGSVASMAAKAGIGGLEFLSGIPGTVGGAVRMNAGAYGAEVCDVLQHAHMIGRDGETLTMNPQDMQMGYRSSHIPDGAILTQAVFEGVQEDKDIVRTRLKEIKAKRQSTQPIAEKTGGSTFANPSADMLAQAGLPEGMRAWQLVEKVGGRDLHIGGARMSDKHLNFMINTGNATAADLENLGDELIRRIAEECGVHMHWEIKRIGAR